MFIATVIMAEVEHVSPILALPAKLRIRIYQYSLVSNSLLHTEARPETLKQISVLPFKTTFAREPPLLLTCRQVRDEALPIFYGGNVFFCELRSDFVKWLRFIGATKRKLIKKLRGFGFIPRQAARNVWSASIACSETERQLAHNGVPIKAGILRVVTSDANAQGKGLSLWVDSTSPTAFTTSSRNIGDDLQTVPIRDKDGIPQVVWDD